MNFHSQNWFPTWSYPGRVPLHQHGHRCNDSFAIKQLWRRFHLHYGYRWTRYEPRMTLTLILDFVTNLITKFVSLRSNRRLRQRTWSDVAPIASGHVPWSEFCAIEYSGATIHAHGRHRWAGVRRNSRRCLFPAAGHRQVISIFNFQIAFNRSQTCAAAMCNAILRQLSVDFFSFFFSLVRLRLGLTAKKKINHFRTCDRNNFHCLRQSGSDSISLNLQIIFGQNECLARWTIAVWCWATDSFGGQEVIAGHWFGGESSRWFDFLQSKQWNGHCRMESENQ